jgi:hypothetical protein
MTKTRQNKKQRQPPPAKTAVAGGRAFFRYRYFVCEHHLSNLNPG